MPPAYPTAEDIRLIRTALGAENRYWQDAFTDRELESMAEDAADFCPGCPPEKLRPAVVRIAVQVATEQEIGI